jgi:hypothetical protein
MKVDYDQISWTGRVGGIVHGLQTEMQAVEMLCFRACDCVVV